MPRAWSEIEQSRDFQDLPRADREAARDQYWREQIRPQVPREQISAAKQAFFDRSSAAVAREQLPDEVPVSTAAGGGRGGQGGPKAEDLARANPPTLVERLKQGITDAFTSKPSAATLIQQPRPADQPVPEADLERQSLAPAAAAQRDAREVAAARGGTARIAAAPDRTRLQRVLDTTNRKPLDQSLAGLAVETSGDAARGAVRGVQSIGKSMWGGVQAGADLLGADRVAGFASAAADAGTRSMDALQSPDRDSLTQKVFESTFANVPVLLGLGTGAKALAAMGGMSGAQAYHEARNRGFTPDEAAERGAVFGIAEMLGEKVGLPALGKLFSKAAEKVGTKELGNALTDLLVKEQVGEQATTAMQDAYEKAGRAGLRPDMTLGDYLSDAADTAKVTLGQSLLMGGGAAVVNRAARRFETPQQLQQVLAPVAQDHGVSPKAFAAFTERAQQLPPEERAGFVSRALAGLERRGLVKKPGAAVAWEQAAAADPAAQPEIVNQPAAPSAADMGWTVESGQDGTQAPAQPGQTGSDAAAPATAGPTWQGRRFEPAGEQIAGPDGRQYLPAMVDGKPAFIPADEITQEQPSAPTDQQPAGVPPAEPAGAVPAGGDQQLGGEPVAGPDAAVTGGLDPATGAPAAGARADELGAGGPGAADTLTPAVPPTEQTVAVGEPAAAAPMQQVEPQPAGEAASARRADFASEAEVKKYLSAQRRAAGIRIAAAPVKTGDGWSFVTKDEPGYEAARAGASTPRTRTSTTTAGGG